MAEMCRDESCVERQGVSVVVLAGEILGSESVLMLMRDQWECTLWNLCHCRDSLQSS